MKSKNPVYPEVIQSLIRRAANFVQLHCMFGRQGIYRAMRTERRTALVRLLIVLAKSACLYLDGAFVRVIDGVAVPMTVQHMAQLAHMSRSNVERCLADLRDLEFIESTKQTKRRGEDGGLEVGPVLRRFTKKFWTKIGLLTQFIQAVRYAAAHSKINVSWIFKAVSTLKRKLANLRNRSGQKTEAERERRRKANAFLEFVACRKQHPHGCLGGDPRRAACALCRKFGSD